MLERLRRRFRFAELGTDFRRETLGGLTTFVTMAYIVVVNPAILVAAGIPASASAVATILVAGCGTILMGLVANRPIGVAPYMGGNAFLAFGVAALGIGWRLRIGAVFLSGIFFLFITLLGVRAWLANSISQSMKRAFAVGIGLFLCFIGFNETGIVKSPVVGAAVGSLFPGVQAATIDAAARVPAGAVPVPVGIGAVTRGPTLVAVLGVLFTGALMVRRVRGALLLGILGTAAAGVAFGYAAAPEGIVAWPRFSGPGGLGEIARQLAFSETRPDGGVASLFSLSMLPVLLTLFLMDFLDTVGTLVGVGAAGNLLDEKGNLPEIHKPMLVDAMACIGAGLLGTTTSGAYVESAAGIREGARSGFAAVVTGALFLCCLFFTPLAASLSSLGFAYGPALIVVGAVMIPAVKGIDFDDMTELLPAFLTIVLMVFTYNTANGLTAGLAVYPLFKVAAGRRREVNSGMWLLSALCLAYFVVGIVH